MKVANHSEHNVNNSGYGAISQSGFLFFDNRIAEGITMTGQFIIQYVSRHFNKRLNDFFKTKDVDYIVYMDTDSCLGDSLVYVNDKQIPIEELYEMFSDFTYSDEFNRSYVKPTSNVTTKSFNTKTENIETKNIKYVMKHRVKKEMFRITTESENSVVVTEDHSVIVKRNGRYITVKPKNIDTENDVVLNIVDSAFLSCEYVSGKCKVESLGVQEIDVYDIEVDDNHNFFANDVLIHNSSFFSLNNIITKHYSGKTDEQITSAIDKLMEQHLRKLIDEATEIISHNQNYYKKTIFFKREKIFSSGFWIAPKKYALKVHDNEGVRYKEPEYSITGIEVVRSSTPQLARDALRECVTHVINKDIEAMRTVVEKTRAKFMVAPFEDIAFPRGVNNLLTYSSDQTIYTKGTPIAVRASLLHNYFLKSMKLENEYQPIEEGAKILFLYLREPNHFKENVIAFVDKIPKQFKLEPYVDRELMFEKVFEAPLQSIMTAVDWQLEEQSSLDSFF